MRIHVFSIFFIWFVNQEISAITYKKFYLSNYSESNSSDIKLGPKSDSVLSLRCSSKKKSNKSEENSTVVLSAPDNGGIVISINSIKFEKSCDSGESVKFESKDKMFMICDRDFDPKIEASGMKFKGGNVTIAYTRKQNLSAYCDFTVTEFRNGPCDRNGDFKCSNGICIWDKLICDHRNNCGDNSDETYSLCRREGISLSPLFYAIPIISIDLLFLVCCLVKHGRQQPRYDAPEVVYIYDGGNRVVPTVGGQVVTQVPPNAPIFNAGPVKNPNERFPNQNDPSTSKQGTDDFNFRKSSQANNETSSANNKLKTSSQDPKATSTMDNKQNNEPSTSKQGTDEEDIRKDNYVQNETTSSKEKKSNQEPKTSNQDSKEDSTKDNKEGNKKWWFQKN